MGFQVVSEIKIKSSIIEKPNYEKLPIQEGGPVPKVVSIINKHHYQMLEKHLQSFWYLTLIIPKILKIKILTCSNN